jgi:hypothetical protein
MEQNSSPEQKSKKFSFTLLMAGLLVGTLDIMAATIQTLMNGRNPIGMLKFIASGVFGKAAFSEDIGFAFYGLFFHYVIAMGWTLLFFISFGKLKVLSKNRILTGIGYGVFVWLCMSRVVLPLSNIPPLPFSIAGAIKSVLILIAAIGLPLSFIASRFYSPITKEI